MLRHFLGASLLLCGAMIPAAHGQDGPQLLYVTGASGNPEITLLKPKVDPAILAGHAASDIWPYWSRNGERVAFSSNRTGRFQIFAMDNAGAGLAQLSVERNGDSLHPSWSPSGEHIVYQYGRHHDWDLVVITADGSEWRTIVDNAWQPDWSPPREPRDRIAFVSVAHDVGFSIYTCEPDGTDIRRIHRLKNTIGHVHPIWSRDAARIAFTDKASTGHEIFTCAPSGGNVDQLTKLGGKNIFPVWSADNKRIYFWHQQADRLWQWMSVDVESREVAAFETLVPEAFIPGARISWY